MTEDQKSVLEALYACESADLGRGVYETWRNPEEVAVALAADHPKRGDIAWVSARLRELWISRKVLQVPTEEEGRFELADVVLQDLDALGETPTRLPVERNDCRGYDGYLWERVALYEDGTHLKYRSRTYEIARLLSLNYQRFNMAPSTGLLRYDKHSQKRPRYNRLIADLVSTWKLWISAGLLQLEPDEGMTQRYGLDAVDRELLSRTVEAVLTALAEMFIEKQKEPALAAFQAESILSTLCGLYSSEYRDGNDGHIVSAGVGSGKSFAFQIGALIHLAYKALSGERGIRVLLLYPRVILAANQFQDLVRLVEKVGTKLGVTLQEPKLDAGGQLGELAEGRDPVRGNLFNNIKSLYQGGCQLLISNLDTLANRIVHPESCEGLTRDLDMIVLDEVHLLSGLYGAHAKMLLKRILLLRAASRIRAKYPEAFFEEILRQVPQEKKPYFLGASATISEPRQHLGRIVGTEQGRVRHVEAGREEDTGFVHHLFLRQRPEASSMTAAINAISCLIHNRRDGLYHEYYQRLDGPDPLGLDEIGNPAQPGPTVAPRDTLYLHKTLGFCDSLDGVNRWADLITDNEVTKAHRMGSSPNPVMGGGSLPYFVRFQEPLWRAVHHLTFGAVVPGWQKVLWRHYGGLCRDCKQGVKKRILRIPGGLSTAQRTNVEQLWDFENPNRNVNHYLRLLGVRDEFFTAPWFDPLSRAAKDEEIGNLDACGFFLSGLCWWWSRDHLGSNHPEPVSNGNPLNGYKQPTRTREGLYSPLSAIRLRSFTSKVTFDYNQPSINDVFRGPAWNVLHGGNHLDRMNINCSLIIGSPRIEVGIDLSRVSEGITYKAMKDPASLQQKTGRVGRERLSDSVLVHMVTENSRDHFYFRNPKIALSPEYLQPIPLHENNQIVARNHYFMAVIDFLCLQGSGPSSGRIGANGHRINLVNDHSQSVSFSNWYLKVRAAYEFLFGGHSRQVQNLDNLTKYLRLLGAEPKDISNPSEAATLTPADAPLSRDVGAVDVFRHEFGPNFLQTQLPGPRGPIDLSQICSYAYAPPEGIGPLSSNPRHEQFLRELPRTNIPMERSYLWQILTLPIFRRGVTETKMPGNQPFLWTPNYYEAVGKEYIRVTEIQGGNSVELGFEPLGLVLNLLVPGIITYRYAEYPTKIPVSSNGAAGLVTQLPGVYSVLLNVDDNNYFAVAECEPIESSDLPKGFIGAAPVQIYSPRRVEMVRSESEPGVNSDGLLADGDSATRAPRLLTLPTPPRCFPLHWYRVSPSAPTLESPPCRFKKKFQSPPDQPPILPMPLPPILRIFQAIGVDPQLEVTEFVWGLDRQFQTRQIDAARLVYRDANPERRLPVALGQRYATTGLRFRLDVGEGSQIQVFLNRLLQTSGSGAYQALLLHMLNDFLKECAYDALPPGAPPWADQPQPSIFTVRNLKTVILFHLLDLWYSSFARTVPPSSPFQLTLENLSGVFRNGHPNYLSAERFVSLCRNIAFIQNPASEDSRFATLRSTYPNFLEACRNVDAINESYAMSVGEDLLINSLALTMHAAALRLTGAEEGNLKYFYKKCNESACAEIFLFDTDEFGNGTSDLLKNTLYISSAERILTAKQRTMGLNPDPLPSTDFANCLEDALQECGNSHAFQLAFHRVSAEGSCLQDLESAKRGEQQIGEPLFSVLRENLNLSSVDYVLPFQACPEFLVFISQSPGFPTSPLVPSDRYPTFQALESAFGFCLDGCIACVVSPEQNLHGVLTAKDSVSKLLLDAFYRSTVCEYPAPLYQTLYPGTGPGRTTDWRDLSSVVASAMASYIPPVGTVTVEFRTPRGPIRLTVVPATTIGNWDRVFRPSWEPAPPPGERVRPRMSY